MEDVRSIFSTSSHLSIKEYNTTIKTYTNGTERIKKTTFSNLKGVPLTDNKHTGKYSIEKLEEKNRLYLKKVKSNIIDLAFNYNKWEYFITLTFDFRNRGEYSHDVAISLLKNWLQLQHKKNKDFTYLIVPEFHKSGRLHFHGLVANIPNWHLTKATNCHNKPIKINGVQIYNLDNYKLGYTTISKIQNQEKVSNYISKYATKELITLKNKKRYWYSRNLTKPIINYKYIDTNLKDYLSSYDLNFYKVIDHDNSTIELASYNI